MRKHTLRQMTRRLFLPSLAAVAVLGACRGGEGSASDSVAATAATSDAMGSSRELASEELAMAPAAPPVASLGRRSSRTEGREAREASGRASQPFASRLVSNSLAGAMLIRQGQASIEVKRVDDAVKQVRATAVRFGGFVANTALRAGREDQRVATLELRVPTDQFDALLADLGTFGKVESVSASVQDVGDEYVDMGARVANARRVEARLVEMLASRTGKLSDVLTVEMELARVREEIERYDARLRWLEKRTSLSTLELTLHEPVGLMDRPTGPLVEALAMARDRALSVVAWCIASLGLIVPLIFLGGIGVVLTRRVLRSTQSGVREA